MAVLLLSMQVQAEDKMPTKVFLLVGQSNMQGFGFISAGKDGDMEYAAKNGFE